MPTWTHPPTNTPLAYADRGTGSPVVLVHAFPFCREMWTSQAEALADSHRVLTPDVFGFGESGLPAGGWTVDSFADALADWLTALGIDQAVVGGLSMGGYVSLAFARRHPQRVAGLILADTRPDADPAEVKANRDRSIALVEKGGVAALVEQMLPKLLGGTTHDRRPEVVEGVRKLSTAQSAAGVTAGLRAMRDRPDSVAALASFQFPALVVVGNEDTATPPLLAHAMEERLPDATLETLWAAGHLSNLETPTEFTTAVRRWLGAIT